VYGRLAPTAEHGFALCDQTGWQTVMRRARQALAACQPQTVLAGLSMGASVAASLLDERPATAGLLLLHNTGSSDDAIIRTGLPAQLHVADPDHYQSPAAIAAWEHAMTGAGASVQLFRYPGARHLFTDRARPTTMTRLPPSPGSAALASIGAQV
jgi:dienelactone hydrolase